MRPVSIILALAAAACSRGPDSAAQPASAQPAPAEPAAVTEIGALPETALAGSDSAPPAIDPLTDRLWALSPGDGRPGVFRIFLSTGAMMQGSCVETYRVSEWRRDGAGKVVWNEDGTDISADVVSVDGSALALGLNLPDGQKLESYTAAPAPFVCPDLPR